MRTRSKNEAALTTCCYFLVPASTAHRMPTESEEEPAYEPP
eukprot:CAMPEP_0118967572 /NCGR_PEP_ID=MMETSP1173-20130426/4946_1 /TAXON_ID=1034831 /ORGANISM="Rhizochromulina marina cf, Strain CCMP1243" /LENGTH=40 /DNA_ID= /DNA_START= /DNA_END= /DNA_ORIENTATION=